MQRGRVFQCHSHIPVRLPTVPAHMPVHIRDVASERYFTSFSPACTACVLCRHAKGYSLEPQVIMSRLSVHAPCIKAHVMLSCMQCTRMAGSAFQSCTTLETTRMGMRRLQSAGLLSTRCAVLSAMALTVLFT